ncbi:ATPase, T2SS/T4P/T4SS family [Bacillus cereus group sp. MYBK15-3]|uniref:ATPase, T2SS/T4P/T4SS family n=1 Tax=Bacillus cereus group TaxID=86661 RepID=UPI001C8CCDE3|nr:ATPase, T2SS/T4P/T4SS family [Bacillus cereus]MBX9158450.1 Flp pilus assembly complex ATPase component TadA [Bacillus cereus]
MFKELQPEALARVNGYVQAGKTVIITGETGTYKTTLFKEVLKGIGDSKNVIIIALIPEEFKEYNKGNMLVLGEDAFGSLKDTNNFAAKRNPDIVCHDGLRSDGVFDALRLWLTGNSGLATIAGHSAESCLKIISKVAASLHDNLLEKGVQYTVEAVDVVVEMGKVGTATRIVGIYEVDKGVKEDIILKQVYDKESYLNRPVGESREGVFDTIMEAALKGNQNLIVSGEPGSGKVHHTQPNAVGSGKGVMLDMFVQGLEDAKDSPYGENRELTETEVVDDGKGGLDFKTSKLK